MTGANRTRKPFVVALTGGIAAGKSAVSERFEALGVPVVDTDAIAHELVEPGMPLLGAIERAFGAGLIDERGRLKRRELRRLVFSDSSQRERLQAILHPAILEETARRLSQLGSAYCIVVIPLLTESGLRDWIDRVLVVDVEPRVQIERVMQRDRVSHEEAASVLQAQASRAARLEIADDVIDNSGALSDLEPQVETLHRKYQDLSSS